MKKQYRRKENKKKDANTIIDQLKTNQPIKELEKNNPTINRNFIRNIISILKKRNIITITNTRPHTINQINNEQLQEYKKNQ